MSDSEWVVFQDEHFIVEECRTCPLPGYLILRLQAPVSSFSMLPPEATLQFGPTLQRVVRGIQSAVQPIRIYVGQFGEEDQDLHFHVFPRTERLTQEYFEFFPQHMPLIHGPLFLDWAREHYRDRPLSTDARRVLSQLREYYGGGT